MNGASARRASRRATSVLPTPVRSSSRMFFSILLAARLRATPRQPRLARCTRFFGTHVHAHALKHAAFGDRRAGAGTQCTGHQRSRANFLTMSTVPRSSYRAAPWPRLGVGRRADGDQPLRVPSTSPLPVMISEASRSATASVASDRRGIAVRARLSRVGAVCRVSASKHSNSVKHRRWRRKPCENAILVQAPHLAGACLMMMLPSVTWPSPRATLLPRQNRNDGGAVEKSS